MREWTAAVCGADTERHQAWIYRWLIAAVCLSTLVVVALLIVVVVATSRRRSRDRKLDADAELKRRQEKYFNTLRVTGDGYYNWTYDPTDVAGNA